MCFGFYVSRQHNYVGGYSRNDRTLSKAIEVQKSYLKQNIQFLNEGKCNFTCYIICLISQLHVLSLIIKKQKILELKFKKCLI